MNDEELQKVYAELLTGRAGGSRAGCPPTADLARLAGAEGSEAERLRTLDHAMACPDCLRDFELLRSLAVARPRGARWGPVPWALAAMLVIALGIGILRSARSGSTDGEIFRGGGDLTLIAPAASARQAAPIAFAWHPVAGAVNYVLAIAENGEVRSSHETRDTTLTLADQLPPGELNWWVEARLEDGATVKSAPRLLRITP